MYDPLHELRTQKRIDDILLISNSDAVTIGQIAYQATWVFNKKLFFTDLLSRMRAEREDLINEIRVQDRKLQLLAKPFGGYISVLDVDDVYFDNEMMPTVVKQRLQVTDFEHSLNQRFNLMGGTLGLRDTRWANCAIYLFAAWTAATCIVCFEKADFLNVSTNDSDALQLTIGLVGLMLFLDPQSIKQSYLRALTFTMPVSLIYDLIWLCWKSEEFWEDQDEAGMDQVILGLIYALVFFKVILFFVLWKSSLNFRKFVKSQRDMVGLR